MCLRLVNSLYGHKRAPLLWFNSSAAFKHLGLRQFEFDECLWYGKDIMIVQYGNDCGISAPTQEHGTFNNLGEEHATRNKEAE